MARKGTRKGSLRLTQRAWAPFGHAMNATGNSVGEVTGTASNIVRRGLKGAKRLGNIWTGHANMAFKEVVSRRGTRRTRRNRRNRK